MERRILIIDDDTDLLEVLRIQLEQKGYTVLCQTSPAAALKDLVEHEAGVVLSDISLKEMSGVDLCQQIVSLREDTPVIVMTAFASMETAVASIRAGAYDFIVKPFEPDALTIAVERAFRHRELREELTRLREVVHARSAIREMVGESQPMQRLCELVARVADSDASVLITGESGTGKELVASALHARSSRAKGPFVAINCAAMPASLLESELFGHVKGAFTDARASRPGLFVKANGGTLFLDEVAEMPLSMQPKLLRALQEKTVRPVGGDSEVEFDARIFAATNRDLEHEVLENRFREDLFYRINVVQLHVPPLRERENDVLLLAQTFLDRHRSGDRAGPIRLSSATAQRLLEYPWPGNVRELQNCMERAVALACYDQVGIDDLPERISRFKASGLVVESGDPTKIASIDEMERRYVTQVLQSLHGNRAYAARLLGIDRRTLYRKLDRWADQQASVANGRSERAAMEAERVDC